MDCLAWTGDESETDTDLTRYLFVFTGDFILSSRPDAVVVETALTSEHGAVPGSSISCSDVVAQGPDAFFLRMFCQVRFDTEGETDHETTILKS